MGKSFQEQMLELGLVAKKQVGEAKKEQHQKKKQKVSKKAVAVVDENVLLAQQEMEKKKARARELNLEREAKLKKRAEEARVRQLIEEHKQEKDDKGIAYRFNVRGTIQRIFVAKDMADQLSRGQLGIVVLADRSEVIPRAVAEKIREINDKLFISLNAPEAGTEPDPDDPYAAYKVPDDLMW